LPFHCSIKTPVPVPVLVLPTAHAFRADVAATPERLLPAGLGLGTRSQALPFHRRIRVLETPLPEQLVQPTAQALRAETAATP
jgi:hypothetical protein